ncbi:TadE/TadG family type IV pilus assembly protein [Streptomyces sp. NPDC057638]|uniref:TadE/TadG family type IV pilus assembly protein n=1 Tax=Streptomyces sp. NPDC057638 TaxID=3346190 RepID=UPI0036BBEEF5
MIRRNGIRRTGDRCDGARRTGDPCDGARRAHARSRDDRCHDVRQVGIRRTEDRRIGTWSPARLPARLLARRAAAAQVPRGQAALEYAGVIALLLFVGLAALQLGIVAYTAQQAGTAARAAARTAAMPDGEGRGVAAGEAAMSDWLVDGADISAPDCGGDQITATVTVEVPALLPVLDFGAASRSVTMPCDGP